MNENKKGIRYFLKNENKQKLGLVWKFAVLGIVEVIVLLVSIFLLDSYSIISVVLGLILLFASLFVAIGFEVKIIYNQVVLTHVDKEKLSLKQVFKKALGLLVFLTVVMVAVYIVMIVSFIIAAIAYNGFVTFILTLFNIALILGIIVVEYGFIYSIIESLLNDEYGFRSTFKYLKNNISRYAKAILIAFLKMFLVILIAGIVYGLVYFMLIAATSAIAISTGSIAVVVLMTIIIFLGTLVYYLWISMALLQYVIAIYFEKKYLIK